MSEQTLRCGAWITNSGGYLTPDECPNNRPCPKHDDRKQPTCPECGTPLELGGYQGTPDNVTEVMVCPACDTRRREPEDPDEGREVDQQLSGRWEK